MERRKPKVRYLGRHMMFKGRYAKQILSGEKITTVRLGIVKPKYEDVIIHGGGRPICKARIEKVEHKMVKELSHVDAIRDGFKDLLQLLKELEKFYGKLNPYDWVTIIKFKVLEKLDKLEPKDPYLGLKPVDIARIALRYLNDLTEEEKSILLELTRCTTLRRTAKKLYGDPLKRHYIRKVVKRALRKLLEKKILKVEEGKFISYNRSNGIGN
ncbi:MAG: ASCH domain-containing protein [archaeon GB-1867-005]|nr:ASCH domain-containing protein [Candidatus Culexmicrobium cathedralense]